MLRVTDTLRLAGTKLRTRKIRLAITVITAGLLFAVLTAGLTLTHAALQSILHFDQGSLNNRYFLNTSAHHLNAAYRYLDDAAIIKRAETLNAQRIAERKAYAKQLGIPYDAASEPPLTRQFEPNSPPTLSLENPSAVQALKEKVAAEGTITPEAYHAAAKRHGAIRRYDMPIFRPGTYFHFMEKGAESFDAANQQNDEQTPMGKVRATAENGQVILEESLVAGFFLDNRQTLPGEIPVIIRYSDAEALLNLPALDSARATPSQRVERLQLLRNKAQNLTFHMCYRNPASAEQIETAKTQKREAAAQKKQSTTDYVAPELQYDLPPANECGPASVTKDIRSAAAKRQDELRQTFEKRFNPHQAEPAEQHKLTYRVVGLMPNSRYDMPLDGASAVLQQIIATQLSENGWIIPKESFQRSTVNDLIARLMATPSQESELSPSFTVTYEFPDAAAARAYRRDATCSLAPSEPGDTTPLRTEGNACSPSIIVNVTPIGSNALVIDDIKNILAPAIFWIFIGVTGLAAFILLIIIGRTIADSRRESAVFRALGATRLTISQIYLTYAIFLAILTALFGISLGLITAWLVDQAYRSELATTAQLIMTPRDLTTEFHLFSLNLPLIGLVILSILAAALLASILPLIRNTRRNPIKDMRDE